MRLVLASTSPRRRELLALLGVPFEVRPPSFEEHIVPGRPAKDLVASFSQGKAYSMVQTDPKTLVLGSDTVIELDGEVLGKPVDLAEARTMLRRIAGRTHQVHTAITLCCPARQIDITQVSTAAVRMKPFDSAAHEQYLTTGDSLGKAGAYSIQGPGSELIEKLHGDFPTVVGLPLRLLSALLLQVGLPVPVDVGQLYQTQPYGNWARFCG